MNKSTVFVRIMCWVLAGLMLVGGIASVIIFLF